METLLSWQKGVKNILNNFNEEEAPKPDEQLLFWMFSFFLCEQYFSIYLMMMLIAGNIWKLTVNSGKQDMPS